MRVRVRVRVRACACMCVRVRVRDRAGGVCNQFAHAEHRSLTNRFNKEFRGDLGRVTQFEDVVPSDFLGFFSGHKVIDAFVPDAHVHVFVPAC